MLLRLTTLAWIAMCGSSLAANELIIKGKNISRHIACEGADLDIIGQGHSITVTGPCRSIEVRGSDHVIHFDEVEDLDIEGSNTKAFGKEATSVDVDGNNHQIEVAIDGEDESGELDVEGSHNKIKVKLLSTVDINVSGKNNIVEWSLSPEAQKPVIKIKGQKNTVTHIHQ